MPVDLDTHACTSFISCPTASFFFFCLTTELEQHKNMCSTCSKVDACILLKTATRLMKSGSMQLGLTHAAVLLHYMHPPLPDASLAV
jgi:hypothetical protein